MLDPAALEVLAPTRREDSAYRLPTGCRRSATDRLRSIMLRTDELRRLSVTHVASRHSIGLRGQFKGKPSSRLMPPSRIRTARAPPLPDMRHPSSFSRKRVYASRTDWPIGARRAPTTSGTVSGENGPAAGRRRTGTTASHPTVIATEQFPAHQPRPGPEPLMSSADLPHHSRNGRPPSYPGPQAVAELRCYFGIDLPPGAVSFARSRSSIVVRCAVGRPPSFWLALHTTLRADDDPLHREPVALRQAAGPPETVSVLRVCDVVAWKRHRTDHRGTGCVRRWPLPRRSRQG
ncbi:DUF6308 family protein [Streptomyces sp. NPDC001820]|uniref:DUF6308 family protein n=1 Tax=Streptomyces sp. NPDC001820 TaxID=3364613 RepID=UPI0036B33694